MNFKFEVKKTANLFHFIANLTDWHFSTRPALKRDWLARTGDLSAEERILLDQVTVVLRKYGFGKNYWGKIFLGEPENKAWELAKNRFGKGDVKVFGEVAEKFSPRFEKLWPEEETLLHTWAGRLEQTQNKWPSERLVDDINTFFGMNKKIQLVEIILLMGAAGNFPNGGGSLNRGQITLEISRLPLECFRPAWLIIWHELIHNLWQDETYHQWMEQVVKLIPKTGTTSPVKDRPLSVVINEGIVESLLPVGYLAQKHFGFPVEEYFRKMLSQKRWRDQLAYRLMGLSQQYIESGRQIDKAYMDQVSEVVGSL